MERFKFSQISSPKIRIGNPEILNYSKFIPKLEMGKLYKKGKLKWPIKKMVNKRKIFPLWKLTKSKPRNKFSLMMMKTAILSTSLSTVETNSYRVWLKWKVLTIISPLNAAPNRNSSLSKVESELKELCKFLIAM